VRLPVRLVRFLAETPELLQSARRSAKLAKRLDARVAGLEKDLRAARAESRDLRKELRDRMLQYNLQLGRLSRTIAENGGQEEGGQAFRAHEDVGRAFTARRDGSPRLSWRDVPLHVDEPRPMEWERVGNGIPAPDPEGREWLLLDRCPICGHCERTIVNAFNKFVLMDKAPDDASARYDYAVCHACGIAYATRRPVGSRFQFLLEHFGEVTGKAGGAAEIKNPLLNPYALTDADRTHLKKLVSHGVWVSEHLGLRKSEYLEGLLKDRFENSVHLDLLASLVAPQGKRVLEIRPRAGTIIEGLRRLFGAQVYAMPIWESQQFLLKEVYGIESRGVIDFDEFEIPYEGTFDLIVSQHMLTHIVRPERFFDVVLRHLAPDGYLYLYNEPDDAEFLQAGQSMLAHLNPLHMQTFDQRSLMRALAARGLEVVFLKRRNLNHMCLARRGTARWTPMTEKERASRVRAYQRARDRAVIALQPEYRGRFAAEWPDVIARGVAEGIAEFDADGKLRLVSRQAPN
jgi:SAM-dependent methyltransferase